MAKNKRAKEAARLLREELANNLELVGDLAGAGRDHGDAELETLVWESIELCGKLADYLEGRIELAEVDAAQEWRRDRELLMLILGRLIHAREPLSDSPDLSARRVFGLLAANGAAAEARP